MDRTLIFSLLQTLMVRFYRYVFGNLGCTSGGSGITQSISDIKKEIPQAKVLNGLRITNKDDILPWLKQIGMQ